MNLPSFFTISTFKQIVFIFASFCAVEGPFLIANEKMGWAFLHSMAGTGAQLVLIGGWLTALCTYSPKDLPFGSPNAPKEGS